MLVLACSTPLSPEGEPRAFEGELLVLVDADMPAYAYANGLLMPRAGVDALVRLRAGSMTASAPAPNTVTTWPGAAAVSPDGRFGWVIANRGSPPPGLERADDLDAALGEARTLTALSLTPDGPIPLETTNLPGPPLAIAVSPDGATLALALDQAGANLVFMPVSQGRAGAPLALDVPVDGGVGPDAGRVTALAWSPDGARLALVLGGDRVALVTVRRDAQGQVVGAEAPLTRAPGANLLSAIAWAPDGAHLYALDTGWGAGRLDRVTNGPGRVHVLAAGGQDLRPVQVVEAGLSPESFALSPDGRRLATLDMRRTYLPPGFPTGLLPGRDGISVTLFAVEPGTGRLVQAGPAARLSGVLPQGIAFDRGGDDLAVTVFQDPDPASLRGHVAFLRIDGEGTNARIVPTAARSEMPRGAHFLLRVP